MKTTNQILTILGLAAIFVLACNDPATKDAEDVAYSLEGTWRLESPTDAENPTVMYKLYSKGRFAFVHIDRETRAYVGAGGGTYTSTDTELTERLEFFSWDSTAVGTEQTFSYQIDGDSVFHQTGTLQTEKYPDYKVDERYARLGAGMAAAEHPLTGVWQIEQARYGDDESDAEELKERYGRVIKMILPGYYYGVFFDSDRKSLNGVTFGKQTADDHTYTEEIIAYSWDSTAVGQVYAFDWSIEDEKFHQSGKIESEKYQDYTIEEISHRIE